MLLLNAVLHHLHLDQVCKDLHQVPSEEERPISNQRAYDILRITYVISLLISLAKLRVFAHSS